MECLSSAVGDRSAATAAVVERSGVVAHEHFPRVGHQYLLGAKVRSESESRQCFGLKETVTVTLPAYDCALKVDISERFAGCRVALTCLDCEDFQSLELFVDRA